MNQQINSNTVALTTIAAILFVAIATLVFLVGRVEQQATFQEKCVAKYADLPHNKVEDYCKALLKFEKDPK